MKKYELTDITRTLVTKDSTVVLHRIKALKDFDAVEAGDYGGWIEKEDNLSQKGNAWVFDEACVYGNAKVSGNASVSINSVVCDFASVCDNSYVFGHVLISGHAKLYGNVMVYGRAVISDQAVLKDNARVEGSAHVYGNAVIYEKAYITDHALISGRVRIHGYSKVYGNCLITGEVKLYDLATVTNSVLGSNSEIYGDASINGFYVAGLNGGKDADISSKSHIIIKKVDQKDIAIYKGKSSIMINYDSFLGTLEEFVKTEDINAVVTILKQICNSFMQ